MGKPKANRKKIRGVGEKSVRRTEENYSIDQILDRAESCMDEYKYELAQKFCQRALEMEADNVRALELTGNLLLECGEVERAQQCLGRAVHVQPDTGHTKYMTLAQLFNGTEARDLYLKGAEVLDRRLNELAGVGGDMEDDSGGGGATATTSTSSSGNPRELKRELSDAYVSVSELYMTDLCDNPEAETESKRYIQLAIHTDSSNPEAHQALANYSLVTGHIEEARASIEKSLDLWLPAQLQFLENGGGTETNLSYTFRLSTAKILLDLEDFDSATKVLDSLLEEDDQVVATWYLFGWMNFLRNDSDYYGNVRYYLNKAKGVHKINPTDDRGMMEHVEEILSEVGEGPEENEEPGGQSSGVDPSTRAIIASGSEVEQIADILDREAADNQDDDKMED